MSNTSHEKATIYQADDFCYSRIEVSGLTWRFQKDAQFPNVARLEYTVRGKRKPQAAMMTIPAVVLDGWGIRRHHQSLGHRTKVFRPHGGFWLTQNGTMSLMLFFTDI